MENHTRDQVLRSASAPYVPSLVRACATASDYRAVGEPSLPNYLGAVSGTNHGIGDDDPPAAHRIAADNLFRQVRTTGRQAVSYQEAMPAPCALKNTGRYAVRHNPAAYFTGGDDRDACQRDDVPLGTPENGALADALDQDALPAFVFVTPDLCNDTHDCPVADGDAWLSRWIPRLIASTAYQRGTTVIFVVWDEPTPMPFVVVAPSVTPATVITGTVNHYALLQSTEQLLGLPLLGKASAADAITATIGR